jgi:alpha-tubulin suppressor-like RCC1 family protein
MLVAAVAAIGAARPAAAAWTTAGAVSTTLTAVQALTVRPMLVGAGDGFTLFVADDGHLYGTGSNASGSLGDGTTVDSVAPVRTALPVGTAVQQIAVGVDAVVVRDGTGRAWSWGGTSLTPQQVELPTSSTVTAVAAGGYFQLALTDDGALYSWGDNEGGRLGQSALGLDDTGDPYPVGQVDAVPTDLAVAGVAAGREDALVWSTDGRVHAWGGGTTWGGATGVDLTFDGAATAPTGIVTAAISPAGVLVLDDLGRIWAADRGVTDLTVWEPAADLDVTGMTVGFSDAGSADPTTGMAAFLTTRAGELYAFGDNSVGELGIGSTDTYVAAPTQVPVPGEPSAIAIGEQHTVLLQWGGGIYAAGDNSVGQFGTGTTSSTPISTFQQFPLVYWPEAQS